MEPYIKDGDVVYVRKTQEINVGDVGIFSVDGAMYCKMYIVDKDGCVILASVNPEMRHTNVRVDSDSGADVVCFGRVILEEAIQPPIYL